MQYCNMQQYETPFSEAVVFSAILIFIDKGKEPLVQYYRKSTEKTDFRRKEEIVSYLKLFFRSVFAFLKEI